MRKLLSVLLGFCLLSTAPARALDIQLISGDWQPINIFVEIFIGEEKLRGQPPSDIIGNDLSVSGNFRIYKEAQNTFHNINTARLVEIRDRGGEYLLSGQVRQSRDGAYNLTFSLHDALTGDLIGSYSVPFTNSNKRLAAHNVANWIYEEIIGKAGVFHTKVAYVLRSADGNNQLKIADYDGHNRLAILSSQDTIISPTWSPDGNYLLYVSFEQNKPIIYRQSLLSGGREIIANFKGSNSAPSISPDNRTIAAALTEHGGLQQIYLLTDERKSRLRETDNNTINTEPTFSPDGSRIAFTSDESGSPQIYEYSLDDNENQRLSYGSTYNVSPDYSSDGKVLALIRRDSNGDNVALLDIRSKNASALTQIRLADSPTFSPNDDIIAFIDETNRKYLATVSINGKVTMFWRTAEEGNITDPTWSPIKSDWF